MDPVLGFLDSVFNTANMLYGTDRKMTWGATLPTPLVYRPPRQSQKMSCRSGWLTVIICLIISIAYDLYECYYNGTEEI